MHSLALKLGLTVLLNDFVVARLLDLLPLGLSFRVGIILGLMLSGVLSWLLAPKLEGEPLPSWMSGALALAAGLAIALAIGGLFYFSFRLMSWRWWLVLAVVVLTIRHLKPRAMLFVGVFAYCMQLGLVQLVSLLSAFVRIPNWIFYSLSLGLSFLLARWLCLGEESPADRVREPNVLWFFAAAGAIALLINVDWGSFRFWMQTMVWACFLMSFLLLSHQLEPDDPVHVPSALGASLVLLVTVFVGLYTTIGTVFHAQDQVAMRLPLFSATTFQTWLPTLVSAAIALVSIIVLKLGSRLRERARGTGWLAWGAILFVITFLLGGGFMGAANLKGPTFELLGAIVIFAAVVGPLAIASQFLLAVGLMRVMFHLDPPPRRG